MQAAMAHVQEASQKWHWMTADPVGWWLEHQVKQEPALCFVGWKTEPTKHKEQVLVLVHSDINGSNQEVLNHNSLSFVQAQFPFEFNGELCFLDLGVKIQPNI